MNLTNRSGQVLPLVIPAGATLSPAINVGIGGYGSVEIYTNVGAGWAPTTVQPLVTNHNRYGICPDTAGAEIAAITLLAGASNTLRATLPTEPFSYSSMKLQFDVATTDEQTIYVAMNA